MPIYDYKCSSCAYSDDLFLKLSDAVTKNCPACGKKTFEKKISAPAFRLNGSGWYETDFKKSVSKTDTQSADTNSLMKTDKQKNV